LQRGSGRVTSSCQRHQRHPRRPCLQAGRGCGEGGDRGHETCHRHHHHSARAHERMGGEVGGGERGSPDRVRLSAKPWVCGPSELQSQWYDVTRCHLVPAVSRLRAPMARPMPALGTPFMNMGDPSMLGNTWEGRPTGGKGRRQGQGDSRRHQRPMQAGRGVQETQHTRRQGGFGAAG
jgi:hypothetical protein